MWCLTEDPSSHLSSGGSSARSLGLWSVRSHPQSNGQTERKNPSSWSQHLLWVEYAHNILTSSATGLSLFQCAHGWQPPLFPALEKSFPASLSRPSSVAICSQAPMYQVGQRLWLSTHDLLLWVESKKLAVRFKGPFAIEKIINQVVVRLKLLQSMQFNPTFHASKVKPVWESPLVPTSSPPPLNSSTVDSPTTRYSEEMSRWPPLFINSLLTLCGVSCNCVQTQLVTLALLKLLI